MVISEIERMLRDDTREKKRTGSGIHSRTGKRGYVGKMYFPYELLSTEDKRNYRKAGKVVRYNMYQEIVSWQLFKDYDKEKQKKMMEDWREGNSASYIIEQLGISEQTYYKKLKDLGVEIGDKRNVYEKITYSPEEKDEIKKNGADYETIMSLKKEDFQEVWGALRDRYTNKQLLAKISETDMNKVYYLNNKLNKYNATDEEKQKKKEQEERKYLFEPVTVTEADPRSNAKPVREDSPTMKVADLFHSQEEVDKDILTQDMAPNIHYKTDERGERADKNLSNFNQSVTEDKPKEPKVTPVSGYATFLEGTFNSGYLSSKLRKLADMVEGEENDFQITLSIEELQGKANTKEDEKEKEMEAKKEIITSILKELF